MKPFHDTEPVVPVPTAQPDGAYLVAPMLGETRESAEAGLDELARLCAAAGLRAMGGESLRVRRPTPALLVGSGQAERVIERAHAAGAALIVFDTPLSPMQLRNWARRSQLEVYDRHAVILEIFSRRARTREAQLQVELARSRYTQSHLAGMWQHLSRQGGGSRLARGEGEKQIELDKRRLAERVQRARRALGGLARQRRLRRSRRDGFFRVVLVGYTNAGKSSLLNALTRAGVAARDQLFATLDPTTRRLYVGADRTVLITDTVGFVHRLPPELVDAFHSTLEEVTEADLLLIVVDAADPDAAAQLATTTAVIADLGAESIPRVVVFNKMDRVAGGDAGPPGVMVRLDVRSIEVSAREGTGIAELRALLATAAGEDR